MKISPFVSSFFIGVISLQGADWPQQGGPNRDGIIPEATAGKLATDFSDKKIPLLWKATVGFGVAPVVASNGKIITYGLYKPGTSPDKLSAPSSAPTFWDVKDAEDKNKDKAVKLHDIPATPDWVLTDFGD